MIWYFGYQTATLVIIYGKFYSFIQKSSFITSLLLSRLNIQALLHVLFNNFLFLHIRHVYINGCKNINNRAEIFLMSRDLYLRISVETFLRSNEHKVSFKGKLDILLEQNK